MGIAIISLILSIAAIGISILALKYSKRQTKLMEKQDAREEERRKTVQEWRPKSEEAIALALEIAPRTFVANGSSVFHAVFPDENLRRSIETYLIEVDRGRNRYSARQVTDEQLCMPILQGAIRAVIDSVAKFTAASPESSQKLGL